MQGLLRLSRAIDSVSCRVGRWVYWLILAAVLVSAGNATVRKIFDISSNAWLELQWYLFGAVFMLAAAYTLERNEHIRIDIVSGMLPKRARDWIEVFGQVFMLLPFAGYLTYQCWFFFINSYRSGEMSGNAGGLILWPARLVILLGFALLFAQGLSELVKRVAVMRGVIPDPHAADISQVPIE
jgi:TRAP-type mannitol/chloroaromatic compound transport system permease small subunit